MSQESGTGFRLSPQQNHVRQIQGGVLETFPRSIRGVIRIDGKLDASTLERALGRLAERHEILRTVFRRLEGMKVPVQIIAEDLPPRFSTRDAGDLSPEQAEAPECLLEATYDATAESPLEALLVDLEDGGQLLLLAQSALTGDGASWHHLVDDLIRLYDAADRDDGDDGDDGSDDDVVQYVDVGDIWNELLEAEDTEEGREQWRHLGLPEGMPVAPVGSGITPATVRVPIAGDLGERLAKVAESLEVQAAVLPLAAWLAVLRHHLDREDLAVGVHFDGRTYDGLEEALGLFARDLPLVAQLDDTTRITALAPRLEAAVAELYEGQDYFSPGFLRNGGDDWAPAYLFEDRQPGEHRTAGDAELVTEKLTAGLGPFIARLVAVSAEEGAEEGAEEDPSLELFLEHDASRLPAAAATRLAKRLAILLESLAADPGLPLGKYPAITADERRELLEDASLSGGPGLAETAGAAFSDRFADRAAREPDRVAVRFDGGQVTYGELEADANRLARHLIGRGAGEDTVVAIFCRRKPALMAAVLAVAKAGAAWVPLDPDAPAERLAVILEDAGASLLLHEDELAELLPDDGDRQLLSLTDAAVAAESPDPVRVATCPESLAYVIYTSGSTGRPKGVMVHRGGLESYLRWAIDTYELAEGSSIPLHSSVSFDLSVTSLLAPLRVGGTVVLVAAEDNVSALADNLSQAPEHGLVKTTPAHLKVLSQLVPPAQAARAARVLVIGGEALFAEDLAFWRRHAPDTRIVNEYGPTETVVGCTFYEVDAETPTAGAVAIGRPIAGARARVVNRHGELVPAGATGELWIGGGGVVRGYLGRPGQTAERFVPDPFPPVGEAGARVYRTGDLVRLGSHGARAPELEFLGRIDNQLKISGYRIEPQEVELALLEHDNVEQVVVMAVDDGQGARLAAYAVPAAGALPTVDELRAFLARRLPEYMVPALWISLEELPLTAHGKVDRAALPAPESARLDTGETYAPPTNEIEELLAQSWCQVLQLERVGIDDSFFALGGDSIRSMQVIHMVRNRGFGLTVQQILTHQTIRELARHLKESTGEPAVAETGPFELVPANDRENLPNGVESAFPLAALQAGMFFHSELYRGSAIYHDLHSLHLRGPFDELALRTATRRLFERHPAFRTSFHLDAWSAPLQLVREAVEVPMTIEDLGHLDAAAQETKILAWIDEEKVRPFDWSRAPLARFHVFRRGDEGFQLTLSFHHAILDGWSVGVVLNEILAAYSALRRGQAMPAAEPLSTSFRDFVALEQAALTSPETRDFWRDAAAEMSVTELPPWLALEPREEAPDDFIRLAKNFDEELSKRVQAAAREHLVPIKSLLLAAHLRVLSGLSGAAEVTTGIVGHGRLEVGDGEQVAGLFLNTLPFHQEVTGRSFAGLAREAFEKERQTAPHRRFPLAEIQRLAGHELFDMVFNFIHYHVYRELLAIPEMEIAAWHRFEETNFALMANFALNVETAQIHLNLNLRGLGWSRAEAESVLGFYERVLETIADDASAAAEGVVLLDPGAREQILAAASGPERSYDGAALLDELIDAQARSTPEAEAVRFRGAAWTYGELTAKASRLARRLVGLGVGPDVRVGIVMERSLELPMALLAVQKAGGAYLPVDPAYPAARRAFMLADAGVDIVLTQASCQGALPEEVTARVIVLDEPKETRETDDGRTESFGGRAHPDSLAYVIYTSGSTGRPKGVMTSHRAIRNRLLWMQETFRLEAGDRVLQKTPMSFDVSVWEFFWPLLTGATLVMAEPGSHGDVDELLRVIGEEKVTTLHFVPSMLAAFLEHGRQASGAQEIAAATASVARVITSGEALPAELRDRAATLLATAEVDNLYGPTEASVDVTWWPCRETASGPDAGGVVPIGRPIANLKTPVVDATLRLLPAGTAGELCLGGVGLARGYLDRPALTAERFVPDPFVAAGDAPGGRLYRTGDRVRLRPGGEIEFLGRLDHQVKVHGFRIELGEIEAALVAHDAVRGAAVVVAGGRLAAYVAADASQVAPGQLREHLGRSLPEHMVPRGFTYLEELPLTPSGKLDRGALPEPLATVETRAFVAPRDPHEETLAQIWADVLGRERIGATDSFFDVGGHSLNATQVIARVRRVFDVEMPLATLFDHPVLGDFAAAVKDLERDGAAAAPPIERRIADDGPRPLSFAQERLWFLEQLDPHKATYNIPTPLRLRGELDPERLERVFETLTTRHEALRARFDQDEGAPVQSLAEAGPLPIPRVDLTSLAEEERWARAVEVVGEEMRQPFDLETGPLLRARLIRLAEDDHLLALVVHHIAADGWSMGVLLRELAALYRADAEGVDPALPEPAIRYADYAAWQRRWLSGEVLEREMEFWRQTLAGSPPLLELPTDRPRPAVQSYRGASRVFDVPPARTAALRAVSREHGTTPFMTLLAALQGFLARTSGQDDVVVGTPVAGRAHVETEDVVGLFVNTLALRTRLADDPRFAELLDRVRRTLIAAYAHQELPFEKLVQELQPERSLSHAPIFQVLFVYHAAGEAPVEIPGLRLERLWSDHGTAKFDLTLTLAERGDHLAGSLEYASDLFDDATAGRFLDHFERFLADALSQPATRLSELAMASSEERRQILAWNRTERTYDAPRLLHHLVEEQVRRTPETTALVFADRRRTYRQLDEDANRLAHRLRRLGVGPDVTVAVAMQRALETPIALLAVLKAGGAYVPVDPDYPRDRQTFMLTDCGARVVLTQERLAAELPAAEEGDRVVLAVDRLLGEQAGELADEPATPPPVDLHPEDLAYVIYTSGSTGRPKAAMSSHRAICNRLLWMQDAFGLDAEDRVLQKTPMSFDVSVWEFFWPLMTGAALVVARPDLHKEADALARAIVDHGVTTLHFVPSMLAIFVAEDEATKCQSLRRVIASGEALGAELRDRFHERLDAELHNLYGPTEAAIDVTWWPCPADESRRIVPIGRPIANLRTHVMERSFCEAPVGVAGELGLAGVGLARGYLARPGLTAERFVPDPAADGGRLYRTGDLARRRRGGEIEFLGRLDHQVKLRGFRIELGEIEAYLAEHPELAEVAVVDRHDARGDLVLVAYVVPRDAAAADTGTFVTDPLSGFLREHLPAFMVPQFFQVLKTLPVTPNGKLDRKALPAPPELENRSETPYVAPQSEIETSLAEVWAEVLEVERVGIDDNFFDLGGHSLLATRVISRLRKLYPVELPLKTLFERPTVAELAELIEARLLEMVENMSDEELIQWH